MKNELLPFLTDYLDATHIHYIITNDKQITLADLDNGLRKSIIKEPPKNISNAITALETGTIYHIIDSYRCRYTFFPLQDDDNSLIFVGPYTLDAINEKDVVNLAAKLSIPAELLPQLQEYYRQLPYFSQGLYIHQFLLHSYRTIYHCNTPAEKYIDLATLEPMADFEQQHIYEVKQDPVLSMRLLENIYNSEDELLDAVSKGNTDKALSLVEAVNILNFTPRSSDTLKNIQSLAITLNTLLRRTAYKAGVHPFYIDNVSTNFARMINLASSATEITDSFPYMVKSYCRLVLKYNLSSYSPTVKHIIVTIDASLDSDLSLKRFADELFLNTSYLSTLFKKETGQTLTDYVNKSRISAAQKLLKSTAIPTQEIATMCGIPDIHYFTRLFRRETGMTPKQWRTN